MSLRRSVSTPSFCYGGGGTVAECCGGTTASCAALWCCGPCSILNLVVLAVYKLPRGLCRLVIRRVRRRRLDKKLRKVGSSVYPLEGREDGDVKDVIKMDLEEEDEDVIELEKEMWDRFYSGGFWRSLSQAETTSSCSKSDLVVSKREISNC